MNDSLLNIKGVFCAAIDAGIKNNDDLDLSVISLTKGSSTAAVFTQNIFLCSTGSCCKKSSPKQP